MFRVMEEYQWGILVQKVPNGFNLRLRLIGEWCKKIWTLNAEGYMKPPMKYAGMKRLWIEFMTDNSIIEYTPGQASNFVDSAFGQSSAKEDKKKTKKEEKAEAARERAEAARGRDRDRRNFDRGGDRNGNRDRSYRDRSKSRARDVEIGRFPSNWSMAVDSTGAELCISFQLGNCKRNEKECPDKRVHLCANVVEKTDPPTLCLEDHMAKKCSRRKKE